MVMLGVGVREPTLTGNGVTELGATPLPHQL